MKMHLITHAACHSVSVDMSVGASHCVKRLDGYH